MAVISVTVEEKEGMEDGIISYVPSPGLPVLQQDSSPKIGALFTYSNISPLSSSLPTMGCDENDNGYVLDVTPIASSSTE